MTNWGMLSLDNLLIEVTNIELSRLPMQTTWICEYKNVLI